jgi:hypothetical protein
LVKKNVYLSCTLFFTVAYVVLLGMNPVSSSMAATQAQQEEVSGKARIIRYISLLPAHEGQVWYGLVLVDDNDIPVKVRVFSDHYTALCFAGESLHAKPWFMQWAYDKQGARISQFVVRYRQSILTPVGSKDASQSVEDSCQGPLTSLLLSSA